jgi:hypothetical protein
MHRLAESRGGKCLSNTYVNSQTPLLWRCKDSHQWKAVPSSVKRGSWCRVCARLSKPSMDDIQHLAHQRGGRCLSDIYVNSAENLLWECKEGHQWKATWDNIGRGGRWCPECSTGLGERICRQFFSQLFQSSFPKIRPNWLVNKAGNQMELDGYSAALGIAFEHQGEQHYSTKGYFIDSESDLSRRQEDDALKTMLCTQRGITLVSVPEIPNRLPLDQVRAFIKEQLAAKGIPLPQDFDTQDVDINRAYRTGGSRETLDSLRTTAMEHGGQCLSDVYMDSWSKLLWQCEQGHKWEAAPANIRAGKWCPLCAGNVRGTLEEMQEIAAARGGKCLSPAYVNNTTKLLWECAKGHRWEADSAHIERGHWCLYCAGQGKKTIEDMKNLAAHHGGQCLSDEYVNSKTHLLWQCKEGHQWKAVPYSTKSGHWCPKCAASKGGLSRKLGLPEMQSIAASRGGRCLSAEYVNANVHLIWQCKEGHQWEALPSAIKGGSWCPVCGHHRPRPRKAP